MPPRGGRGRRRCRAGRGRSRPSSKSCETPGASSHVSRRFPFSRPRPAPRPARGPPSASRPGGETLRPAPDPLRPSSSCGHGSRRKPVFLSALRLGGSVRGASPQSPRPEPDQGDSRLPIPSPHSPGRPPASATRPDPSGIPTSPAATHSQLRPSPRPPKLGHAVPAPGAVFARPRTYGFHRRPVLLEAEPRARGPPPQGPGRQPTRLAALTSGSSPRSHSHPEPRRPSEHLEEGGTPGTWQL